MHLRYDDDFVEVAVFRCAFGRRQGIPPRQIARFHFQRERLYSVLDPDARNHAFARLQLEWFREWGLETLLTGPLHDFPLLPEALKLLAFRKPRGRDDEGAELYVNEAGDRNGVVALRPERLEHEAELGPFLRHELTHLHDMVTPGFGYLPDLPRLGPSLNQHRLARERYRLLWDVSIDGRLARLGRQTIATREQRWSNFASAFAFCTEARQREVFDSLWSNPVPTHRALAELACDPRHLEASASPRPGAPCPLCGFPTFAWAEVASLTHDTLDAIRAEFPHWVPEHGACARCFQIYRPSRARTPAAV